MTGKNTAPSRFAVVVIPDLFTACEECPERYYFYAISVEDVAEIDEEKYRLLSLSDDLT